jgi:RNA polymerase sigma-70 factor (ECF subfamily)
VELMEEQVPIQDSSHSVLSPVARQVLETVDGLPEDEREAFDLVHVQGLSQAEAAELLGVAARTVKRRLDRGIQLLAERLVELSPEGPPTGES